MATQLQRASGATTGPSFDANFRRSLTDLLAWRRDVRRFVADPVDAALIDELLDLACLAPSVGNSQPWRFVSVASAACRREIRANFEHCNAKALGGYAGEKAALYAGLKLAGLAEAPVQLAVFADEATEGAGHRRRLGLHTRSGARRPDTADAGRLVADRLSLPRLSGRGAPGSGTGALRLAGPRCRLPPGPGALRRPRPRVACDAGNGQELSPSRRERLNSVLMPNRLSPYGLRAYPASAEDHCDCLNFSANILEYKVFC
jgi:nitroreductase